MIMPGNEDKQLINYKLFGEIDWVFSKAKHVKC